MFMRDRNSRQYQLELSPQARVMKSWERREMRNPITGLYRGEHEPTQLDAVADQYENYARRTHQYKNSGQKQRPQTAQVKRSSSRKKRSPVKEYSPVKVQQPIANIHNSRVYENSPESSPKSAQSSPSSYVSSAPSESYFHAPNSPVSRILYRVHNSNDDNAVTNATPYNAFLTDPVARNRNDKTRERIEWVSKYKEQIDSYVSHQDRKHRQKSYHEKVTSQQKLRDELDKQSKSRSRHQGKPEEDIFGKEDNRRRHELRQRCQTLRQDQLDLIAFRKAQAEEEKRNEVGFQEQPIFVRRQNQIQQTSRQLAKQLREDNLALMKAREQRLREESKPVYYRSSLFY